MGCSCRKRIPAAGRIIQRGELPPGMLTVRFVGDSRGSRTYKTPLGNTYRFGAGLNSLKRVFAVDRNFFERSNNFEVVVASK